MKYLFVLGRNPKLSESEIKSFLKKEDIRAKFEGIVKNSLLIETQNKLPEIIKNLGGTIAIGEILAEGSINDIKAKLEKTMLYLGTENKLTYSIWNFSDGNEYNLFSDYLKKRFRKERLKASEKPLTGRLELQNGGEIKIAGGNITEEFFVLKNAFGKIIQRTNYSEIEKRDMWKPERRESLAISPRLAKIMLNFSETKAGETIVDPFCGIGVILQEALIQGINVIGIDKDSAAVSGAKRNLEWAKTRAKYFLINEDSKRAKISRADSFVSEPWLGETLKKIPAEANTRKILNNYETLVSKVLNNLKRKISGKFVFTAPYILLFNKERIGCNINSILSKTSLKLKSRFQEYRKNQIVGREIFVLEK